MLEIENVSPERFEAYWHLRQRDALTDHWRFRVVWHEQRHHVLAVEGTDPVAGVLLRIAASLAHVETFFVEPQWRRRGIGRALLMHVEDLAKYQNCHKMTLETFTEGDALRFFEACAYKQEAILPQHTFKLDVAVMRKFLL
ncbi:MAG TPA: GNAT family N-acetyltransferase [Candidatus Baltobacteraceae bacterium]|nr:GNAT family N-acetyltransferase [Candidatus Baltobacteraceae bacterium]